LVVNHQSSQLEKKNVPFSCVVVSFLPVFGGLIGESISLPPPNRVYHILWNVCLVMFGGQKFRQRQVGKVEDGRKHYHIHPAAASTTVQ